MKSKLPAFGPERGAEPSRSPPPLQRTGSVTALRPEGPGLRHPSEGGQGPLQRLSQGKAGSSAPHAPRICHLQPEQSGLVSGLSRCACGCPSPNPVPSLHSKEPPLRRAAPPAALPPRAREPGSRCSSAPLSPSPYILRSPRPRPGPALVLSSQPVGYHLLLRLRLRILCPSGGPSPPWDPFPSRPPGPHWPGPPQQFESLATGRDRSQDHRLPSEVPAALPVLLPGTFELFSALPRALPELGQLLGLLQQPAWAPLPPLLHPGAGLPPLLHCGAAFPFLLVLLAGPQPLLLHHRPARGASPRRRAPPVRAVRRPPHHPQAGLVAPATPLLHPRAHPALLLHRRTHAPLLLHAELQPAELLRAPAENPDPLRLLLRQPWAEPAALFLHDSPPGAPSRHCPTHSPAPQRPRGPAPPDGAVLGARSHRPPPSCFRPFPRGRGLRGSVPSLSAPNPGPGSPPSLLGVEVRPPGAAPSAGPRRCCGPARRPESQERPPSRRSSWSPPAPAPPQGGGARRD
ncbi:hypothetical protein R6Z07F_001462 [Ovis aries]